MTGRSSEGQKTRRVGGSHWIGVGSLHESDCPHPVSQRFREETAKCEGDHSSDTVPQEDGWLITGQGQYRLQVTGQVLQAVISVGWSRGPSQSRQIPDNKSKLVR